MTTKLRAQVGTLLFAGLGLFTLTPSLRAAEVAAGPGAEVVVVYNKRLPASKAVADHYAQRRGVPAGQVLGLDMPTTEDVSRSDFRKDLQEPLARWIEDKKLWRMGSQTLPATNGQPSQVVRRPSVSRIRYVVLCFGTPLRILAEPGLTEPGNEKWRPELRRDEAAVDSELALLPLFEDKPHLLGPIYNPFYATTNPAALHPTNGMVIVTRLDGPTADIASRLVDKAIEAETDGLCGRAYFDLRGISEAAYRAGDDTIRRAAESLRAMGFETIIDTNGGTFPPSFPMSQIGFYAGWYDEHVSGPFAQPVVEFMPGAFAYHLHSFSAATIRSTNEHWVGPLLAKGATATMGCVFEPFLAGTPDIGILASRLLASRFTFGEAAYASQPLLSWQTTVVGDPLYRPALKDPKTLEEELNRAHNPLVEWSELRWVNFLLAQKAPVGEAVMTLEKNDSTRQSAVLMEKLGDLYDIQGKPGSAIWAYQHALTLKPSPQQQVRLMLGLAEKLMNQQRETDASAVYDSFLKTFPSYPDRATIQQKLSALAEKSRPADSTTQTNAIK